ncbi:MAG: copper homeostasis membrane protein CopD [Proteobacteria bacterium]|nr:copper homeostasis membrane protein CopD [Pseudomonadota bacterium]
MFEPLAIVRAVHFAACLTALGTAGFAMLAAGPAGAGHAFDRRLRSLAAAALAAAVFSGALWFGLVASRILDVRLGDILRSDGFVSVATDTRFGRIALLRLALAAVAAVSLLTPRLRWPGLAALAALTGAIAWTGHAGAGTGGLGTVQLVSDVVHLIAAALWLGALPALAWLLICGRADPDGRSAASRATRRFSSIAVACVGLLATSGLVNSAILLGWPDGLLASAYGRVLALKVAVFGAMLALAAVNRYRLTPRLPAPGAIRRLSISTLAETGLGAGVVLLAAILGTLPPASHLHMHRAAVNPDAAFVHIHTAEVMADLSIDPGQTGLSTAAIKLWHEDYSPFFAERVQLALDPALSGTAGLRHDAHQLADGTWAIDELRIQSPGVWTARVIINSKGQTAVLDAPIVITQCSNDCR